MWVIRFDFLIFFEMKRSCFGYEIIEYILVVIMRLGEYFNYFNKDMKNVYCLLRWNNMEDFKLFLFF